MKNSRHSSNDDAKSPTHTHTRAHCCRLTRWELDTIFPFRGTGGWLVTRCKGRPCRNVRPSCVPRSAAPESRRRCTLGWGGALRDCFIPRTFLNFFLARHTLNHGANGLASSSQHGSPRAQHTGSTGNSSTGILQRVGGVGHRRALPAVNGHTRSLGDDDAPNHVLHNGAGR